MTATDGQSRFLDLRALAALEHLRFSTKNRVEGSYSGRHRSRQLGGAGEFVDYREYTEGDDLRRLDWKVLGRTGRSYLRLCQDETNLVCTAVIDASNSMRFGEDRPVGSKLEYAQYFATALSHVIAKQQDQVGVAVIDETLRQYIAPGGTSIHVTAVQSAVESIQSTGTTGLAEGLRTVFERSRRRGVLMILSDFLVENLEEVFASLRLFRHRNWSVIAMHLVHPEEERLPRGLAFRFEGLENEGRIDCSPAEIARQYAKRFDDFAASVRALSLASGCIYRRVSTTVPYLQTLGGFLVERAG